MRGSEAKGNKFFFPQVQKNDINITIRRKFYKC